MLIVVETYSNGVYTLNVDPERSIMFLKLQIQLHTHIPADRQLLVYAKQVLEPDMTLKDYRISAGAVIKLLVPMTSSTTLNWSSHEF